MVAVTGSGPTGIIQVPPLEPDVPVNPSPQHTPLVNGVIDNRN